MNTNIETDLIAGVLRNAYDEGGDSLDESVPEVLRTIRKHLGMDVAFVSEFTESQRTFRFVDSASEGCPVQVGNADPLEESYCQRVVDGRLPELIHDALLDPVARALPVTQALPVRAHLSVPIYLSDGELYGTFCCFSSSHADHTLDQRDLAMMQAFADFAGKQIEQRIKTKRLIKEKISSIRSVIDTDAHCIHYQPIFHVEKNTVIGYESLSRFSVKPFRTPDVWFRDAEDVGLGNQLEMSAIKKALVALDHLPDNIYIALNSSPKNIISGVVGNALVGAPLERIVLEVTEHSVVSDYKELASALSPLRQQGLRFAVDDAGAGYASFRHILQLKPDMIKLDMGIIRDIDSDDSRRALAAAIIGFAEQTGSVVIAEGVETESELATLKSLQVAKAQGYLLGRPGEMAAAIAFCNNVGG